MTKATTVSGELLQLKNCFIEVPGFTGGETAAGEAGGPRIILRILPEITDSKSASYNDEPILGRSMPLKTYSHSENRTITMNAHFMVTQTDDIFRNLGALRALESAVYPREEAETGNNPFLPPPVCKIQCGELLAGTSGPSGRGLGVALGGGPIQGQPESLCVVLRSYSVNFPVNVPWDGEEGLNTYLPYRFSVNLQWDVVYTSKDLPGQERILRTGGALGGI
jgi:hypothetical protein